MIYGRVRVKIKSFCWLDPEQPNRVYPKDDEEFWGVPYEFCADASAPFIEVRKKPESSETAWGAVRMTININAVSDIEFEL